MYTFDDDDSLIEIRNPVYSLYVTRSTSFVGMIVNIQLLALLSCMIVYIFNCDTYQKLGLNHKEDKDDFESEEEESEEDEEEDEVKRTKKRTK